MYLDACLHKELAKDFEILNLDSGHFVRGVYTADDFSGECEMYLMDEGGFLIRDSITGEVCTVKVRFNWAFVYKGE